MDWRRGKSVLILSFLLLNLFLVGRLYFVPEIERYLRPARYPSMEAVLSALEIHGVVVAAPWPQAAVRTPFAQVSLRRLNLAEIDRLRRRLLGDGAVRLTDSEWPTEEQPVTYTAGAKDLVVTVRGHVSYHNRQVSGTGGSVTSEEAIRIAGAFFKDELGDPQDFVFDNVAALEAGSYRVEYVQTFREHLIFPGYIIIVVQGDEVAAMWMSRLNVAFEAGGAKPVLPAPEAVLSLLNQRLNAREEGSMEILGVEFGYHSLIYDALDPSWRGVPVWRIRTREGIFFINAHSGVLES